jgi:4-amino-4-deoxy-L-arabinose transferase-like glycosyltransferase
MDEPTATPRCRLSGTLPILVLLTLALGLRLIVIARTEVAARDSIGFIRYALRFEREPWADVIRTSEQPPGYALVVLLVSQPVRAWAGETTCDGMVLSAQLASALMAVFSVIPMVRLGRELSDRRVGWLAAAAFLTLPAWLRMTSDGLSEATYLFWLSLGLWLGVRALRRPGASRFFLCGLAAGAAYLTRPEGLEIAVAVGLVLFGFQAVPAVRQQWCRLAGQGGSLAAGVLVFLGPYVAVTGHLTNKNTPRFLIGDPAADPARMLPHGQAQAGVRTPLAAWMHDAGGRAGSRWLWALQALGHETAQGFQYVGLALAAVGLICLRPRAGGGPGLALLGTVVGLHVLILCRMASVSGYLSERHTLLLIVAGCFPLAAALLWLGGRWRGHAAAFRFAVAAVGVMLVAELLTLRKPLHGNRAGHKAAGRWLATQVTAADAIIDPFNWAAYYARPPLPEPEPPRPDQAYVVLETSDNQHSRLPALAGARKLAQWGEAVYHWPERRPRDHAHVVVYRVPGALLGP